MLNDLGDQRAVLDVALDLFRDRAFLRVLVGTLLGREHDIDRTALAGENLCVETLVAEVDGSTIDLIQQDGRHRAVNLQSKLGRLDNVEAADERIDDDGQADAVVNGDGVRLAGHLDDALVAA